MRYGQQKTLSAFGGRVASVALSKFCTASAPQSNTCSSYPQTQLLFFLFRLVNDQMPSLNDCIHVVPPDKAEDVE